jgi:lipoyl(octanoyl) transferase
MIDLERKGLGPRHLVSAIEESIVQLLNRYNVSAYPKSDAPGVYVDDSKVASLGLRIRKGKSFHGLALNIDMDLEPFLRINPCGYAGMRMTQLSELVSNVSLDDVANQLVDELKKHLDYTDVVFKQGLP